MFNIKNTPKIEIFKKTQRQIAGLLGITPNTKLRLYTCNGPTSGSPTITPAAISGECVEVLGFLTDKLVSKLSLSVILGPETNRRDV